MTTFDTQLTAELASVFFNTDEFAESITYTPSGGTSKTVKMIPDEEDPGSQTLAPPGDSMIILVQSAEVTAPLRGDTYTIGGITWYHEEIIRGGPEEGVYHIRLTRSVRRVVKDRAFIS